MTLSSTRHRLLLVLAALLFSTGGAAIKSCSLSGWQIASLRSGVAAIALFTLLRGARRIWDFRILPTALAYAATLVLFVTANKLTTSANAIFLQATGPLYMLILGPLVLKERVRAVDWAVVASVAAGGVLLFNGIDHASTTATNPHLGNILGACSGLTWALTLTGLRLAGKRHPSADTGISTVVAGNLVAFAVALPMALPIGHIQLADAAVLVYLGVFQIGLAYFALTRGIKHVPGLESSTILLVEPVFNPIWTWMLHGEVPSGGALWGGALIVIANLGAAAWDSRQVTIPERLHQQSKTGPGYRPAHR